MVTCHQSSECIAYREIDAAVHETVERPVGHGVRNVRLSEVCAETHHLHVGGLRVALFDKVLCLLLKRNVLLEVEKVAWDHFQQKFSDLHRASWCAADS